MISRTHYLRIFSMVIVAVASLSMKVNAASSNGHTVVVDAGHGTMVNQRPGTEGPTELAIAEKLSARLKQDGYRVVMTRTSNGQALGGLTSGPEYKDTRARAAIANAAGAEFLLSIHSDDYKSDAYHVIYPDVIGPDCEGVANITHINNYLTIAKQMASKIDSGLTSSGFNRQRAPHGEAYNNTSNTRCLGDPFMISAHAKVPDITVEVYGHKSSSLIQKYSQSSTQDKVAAALEKGVNAYFAVAPATTNNQPAAAQPASVQPTANTPATLTPTPQPKIDRGDKCPPDAPTAGPVEGSDYRAQIAQAFMAEFSRQTETLDQAGAPTSDYGGEDIITGSGDCALPIPGNSRVVSGLSGLRGQAQHRGYDFSAPTGTKIVSVMEGEVALVEDQGYKDGSGYWGNTSQNGGYGNLLRIKHNLGGKVVYSEYHHLRTGSIGVKVGNKVVKGQVIAQVDHNGWSSGAHLHFQLMNQNSSEQGYFDPGKCLGLK